MYDVEEYKISKNELIDLLKSLLKFNKEMNGLNLK